MIEGNNKNLPQSMRLTEPPISWNIEEPLMNGVITKAVWSVEQRPGTWQKMLQALYQGAGTTVEGTASSFLFQAMVDRLLEEYHALEEGHTG